MDFTLVLPHEIWDMIAIVTHPDDLANLRLVSNSMSIAATRPFGMLCLAHRRFIVSPYSLQGLVQLTAHPILGTCLESISLGTWRVNEKFEDSQAVVDGRNTKDAAHGAARVQGPFEKAGHHARVLTEALNNIKHHNIEVSLGIHDDVVHDQVSCHNSPQPTGPVSMPHWKPFLRRAYGFEELYGQLDLSNVGIPEQELTLKALCVAMTRSAYYPGALTFDFDMNPANNTLSAWSYNLGGMIEAIILPEHCTKPLFDLTIKLCADSTCTVDHWSVHDSFMTIRTDQTLELIKHSFQSPLGSQSPPDLYTQPYGDFTPVLHEKWFSGIVLTNCEADLSFPYMWLRSRSSTLRRLEMLNLYLVGYDGDPESGIRDLWSTLKHMRNLETLILHNFYFSDTFRSILIRGRVTWSGAQIGVGLQKLIDMADEWSSDTCGTFDMPQVV